MSTDRLRVRVHRLVLLISGVTVSSCSMLSPPFTPPPAAVLPELEQQWSADRTDPELALLLAAGYAEQGQPDQSRRVLQTTHDVAPGDPTLTVSLGVIEQGRGAYVAADTHFRSYQALGTRTPIDSMVAARQLMIRPHVLRAEAARRLSAGPQPFAPLGRRGRTAVLPFTVTAGSGDDIALGTVVGELIARDLARSGRTMVSPDAVRAVLEAAGLAPAVPISVGEAARVGGILGADRVVYGSIEADTISVAVLAADDAGPRVVTHRVGGAPTVLDRAKRAVGRTLLALSESVTVDQAAAAAVRDVLDTDAAVAFGRGLLHADAGRFQQAAAEYARAAALDSTFALATERHVWAATAVAVEQQPLADALVEVGRIGELHRAVAALRARPTSVNTIATGRVGTRDRLGAAELFGVDGLASGLLFELVLTLPGGTP